MSTTVSPVVSPSGRGGVAASTGVAPPRQPSVGSENSEEVIRAFRALEARWSKASAVLTNRCTELVNLGLSLEFIDTPDSSWSPLLETFPDIRVAAATKLERERARRISEIATSMAALRALVAKLMLLSGSTLSIGRGAMPPWVFDRVGEYSRELWLKEDIVAALVREVPLRDLAASYLSALAMEPFIRS
eukprot:Amastigsp_a522664_6.p1 type:complete len:190 gc:universal Amastigsp_a522664_6:100-669(+)